MDLIYPQRLDDIERVEKILSHRLLGEKRKKQRDRVISGRSRDVRTKRDVRDTKLRDSRREPRRDDYRYDRHDRRDDYRDRRGNDRSRYDDGRRNRDSDHGRRVNLLRLTSTIVGYLGVIYDQVVIRICMTHQVMEVPRNGQATTDRSLVLTIWMSELK